MSKQDLLEVACEVLSLYELPKAEYAPISKDAQREQRHLAALKQTAASPISGRPNPGRSPGTASVGAGQQLDLARDTAAAPAGDHGSDGHVNSAEHASSALRQVRAPTMYRAKSLCLLANCPHVCLFCVGLSVSPCPRASFCGKGVLGAAVVCSQQHWRLSSAG